MGIEAWAKIITLQHHDPGEIYAELDGFRVSIARPSWQLRASCAGMGPAAFFPAPGESVAPARELCPECPVRADCLNHALEHDEQGWWAGTSERERRKMRRAMTRDAA
jgi:WhiB family transcriptional regulator, redox-sensing transcriptional regulator